MEHTKRIAAAAALLMALAAAKLLLPDLSAAARDMAASVIPDETDYRAVFASLGEWIAPAGEAAAEAPSVPAPSPSPAPAPTPRYRLEEAASLGETAPIEVFVIEEIPTAAETEEEPAAVAAFLESQAAFLENGLPDNVDYGYLPLPFAYTVPVAGLSSSGFGYRLHPLLNYVRFHYGTDFAANAGEEIRAFADGTVGLAGEWGDYGNCVVIGHGDGWTTLYGHCSVLLVTAGQRVSAGETIAYVGATGLATGPHLHFELRRDGVYYNPEYYLNG